MPTHHALLDGSPDAGAIARALGDRDGPVTISVADDLASAVVRPAGEPGEADFAVTTLPVPAGWGADEAWATVGGGVTLVAVRALAPRAGEVAEVLLRAFGGRLLIGADARGPGSVVRHGRRAALPGEALRATLARCVGPDAAQAVMARVMLGPGHAREMSDALAAFAAAVPPAG